MAITTAARASHPVDFPQCWYPIALSREVAPGTVAGADFLDGRVVCYRGEHGRARVLSAYCRHTGLDLCTADVIGDEIRCPFHYWQFGEDGRCTKIPVSDRIPEDSSLFAFPTAESLGLVWAFNGTEPLYDVPSFPGIDSDTLAVRAECRGEMHIPHWLATANSMDFQHLEVVHGVPNTVDLDAIEITDTSIEYDMVWDDPDFGRIEQHIKDFGTNVVSIIGTMAGVRVAQFFAGRPTPGDGTVGYLVVSVPRAEHQGVTEDAVRAQLEMAFAYGKGLIDDDQRILPGIRFKADRLVPADRGLSRFLRYVDRYPRAHPSERFIT
ncbi:MAG TPA: Rieske 2Fe-2S domain-containing protein [Acidimicrobiia bacterium]